MSLKKSLLTKFAIPLALTIGGCSSVEDKLQRYNKENEKLYGDFKELVLKKGGTIYNKSGNSFIKYIPQGNLMIFDLREKDQNDADRLYIMDKGMDGLNLIEMNFAFGEIKSGYELEAAEDYTDLLKYILEENRK